MPAETEKSWEVTGSGVSIENGVMTVSQEASDAEVYITVRSGAAEAAKLVKVYAPVLSEIRIDGSRSIEIPISQRQAQARAYERRSGS